MLINTGRDADPKEYIINCSWSAIIFPAPVPLSLPCAKDAFFSSPGNSAKPKGLPLDGSLGLLLPTQPATALQRAWKGKRKTPDPAGKVSDRFRKARLHIGEALIPWKTRRNHGDMLLCNAFPTLHTEPKLKFLKAGSSHHHHNWLLF